MRNIFMTIALMSTTAITAQNLHPTTRQNPEIPNEYRATATKINDLVHTRLDVKFDFAKAYLYGKAWITLQPHFYPTDSLSLDAKGMNINEVVLVNGGKNIPLKYTYDSTILRINLGQTFKKEDKYIIYIDYVSKPNELKNPEGSMAIKEAKGLYFVNPKGEDKDKPTQIWTQGETEANSVWFPTIDKPNQKTTEEINITVPAKYVTLSNGLLVNKKNNTDGTRTDSWKMDLPHAPYLFFMGIGEYAIVKDSYKGKEVSYYVEKEYENVARKIFGNTPDMIDYFSRITGVEYVWPKYAQIVGRDYVSGAMENTTATLHQESAQQNARELVDGNNWESTIAHELYHHWFGDLVTCESWSNLALNESFANYSEVLWYEYKYGKDMADEHNYVDMTNYFSSQSEDKDLVRYYYKDREDMFDLVSYNKGGRVLHMLRNYVGDSAFFRSLNLYLTQNKFKSAEVSQLRMAFEEVTGEDLNWYFNQWFYNSGEPFLDISYQYNEASKSTRVTIKQTQTNYKVFRLPITIDVYVNGKKTRYKKWLNNKTETFDFVVSAKPDLINVDADKVLLAHKDDHKTLKEFIYQYNIAGNYVDRREALEYAMEKKDNKEAQQLVFTALNDPYYGIRSIALKNYAIQHNDETVIKKIEGIAKNDPYRPNRAIAIRILGDLQEQKYKPLFMQGVKDSSYTVAGASLIALVDLDEQTAINLLPELEKDARGTLMQSIDDVKLLTKSDINFDSIFTDYKSSQPMEKLEKTFSIVTYLSKVENTVNFKMALDASTDFANMVGQFSAEYRNAYYKELDKLLRRKEVAKNKSSDSAALEEQIKYLKNKIGQK